MTEDQQVKANRLFNTASTLITLASLENVYTCIADVDTGAGYIINHKDTVLVRWSSYQNGIDILREYIDLTRRQIIVIANSDDENIE